MTYLKLYITMFVVVFFFQSTIERTYPEPSELRPWVAAVLWPAAIGIHSGKLFMSIVEKSK